VPAPEPFEVYRERLRVPAVGWLFVFLLALSVLLVLIVVVPGAVALVGAIVAGLGLAAATHSYGSLLIAVHADGLTAGRATLPWPAIGTARALDAAETRAVLGPRADARAFLLIRGYVRTAVLVEVDDVHDPAPYWLLSSRQPERLVRALTTGRGSERGAAAG
jgi:DUF3093 family protein